MFKTVYQLFSKSDRCKDWIEANVNYEPYQMLGDSIVVEHRYIGPIAEGLLEEGFQQGIDFDIS